MTKRIVLAAIAAIALLCPVDGSAALISGQMSFGGSAVVDAENIDWTPIGGGTGVFGVDSFVGNTGYFASLQTTPETVGSMLDLNLTSAPVGVPNLGIANFITFASVPGLTFTLDLIAPGPFSSAQCGDAPAAGQTCSFPGSPFGLSNPTAQSSDVSLVLFGTVTDGSGDLPSKWRATFTTQFDVPYQELLDIVFNQGGSVANTYSATLVATPVPEPASVMLLGAGLLGLAWFSSKRKTS
jgi:hypothetical protein